MQAKQDQVETLTTVLAASDTIQAVWLSPPLSALENRWARLHFHCLLSIENGVETAYQPGEFWYRGDRIHLSFQTLEPLQRAARRFRPGWDLWAASVVSSDILYDPEGTVASWIEQVGAYPPVLRELVAVEQLAASRRRPGDRGRHLMRAWLAACGRLPAGRSDERLAEQCRRLLSEAPGSLFGIEVNPPPGQLPNPAAEGDREGDRTDGWYRYLLEAWLQRLGARTGQREWTLRQLELSYGTPQLNDAMARLLVDGTDPAPVMDPEPVPPLGFNLPRIRYRLTD